MFRNFFITAYRNITGNKVQSVIQVISLSIGVTAAILIGLTVSRELSYDRFHKNYDRIYRLEHGNSIKLVPGIGHHLKQNMPEIENVVRMITWEGKDDTRALILLGDDSTDERTVNIPHQYWADSSILNVFTFDLIQGDRKSALRVPQTCLISRSAARTLFGEKDPIGERTSMGTITGVFEDLEASHFEINVLAAMVNHDSLGGIPRGEPGYLQQLHHSFNNFITYVLLPEGADPGRIEQKIFAFFEPMPEAYYYTEHEDRFHLRPLGELYFCTDNALEDHYSRHGNPGQLKILSAVSLIILLLAMINYINLTTTRASMRFREVAIRKVAGSSRIKLVLQFQFESILLSLFSLLVALTLAQLLIPGFNNLALSELDPGLMLKPLPLTVFLGFTVLIGAVSGLYPAIAMGRVKPVPALSQQGMKGPGSAVLRRVLLTGQFAISMILIIAVFTFYRQLNYMKNADLGFQKDHMVISSSTGRFGNDYPYQETVRERLLRNPSISGVTFSNLFMGDQEITGAWIFKANENETRLSLLFVDPGFMEVFEINMVEGRNLSWDRPADNTRNLKDGELWNVLINKSARKVFELDSAVGTVLRIEGNSDFGGKVIGVVDDFHFQSQHHRIKPSIYIWGQYQGKAAVRISPGNVAATLQYIEEVMESPSPYLSNLQFTFLDDRFDRQYARDERYATLISAFTLIAIIIACLGLFGLSSFLAARKVKEIGIRKVFGASVRTVFIFLSREFIKWVVISIVIALPLGYLIMHRWLQGYAYRTSIPWWIFVLAILIGFAITFATVTWQSLKTARTNPVDSLRYE